MNILVGENGSGKTTVLEAVDILSRGVSFRTRNKEALIRLGEHRFQISGRIQKEPSLKKTIKIEKSTNAPNKIEINGMAQNNRLEAIKLLPTRIFHPESYQLVYGGSAFRRKYMDWGVFHMEHSFADDWIKYQKSLRQRDFLLKRGASKKEVESWNAPLVKYGTRIDSARKEYLTELSNILKKSAFTNKSAVKVQLEYLQGWHSGKDLEAVLFENLKLDFSKKRTTEGVHRADISIQWKQNKARNIVSRGQQKSIALALLFAQIDLFINTTSKECLIIVDDLTSELDEVNVALALEELERLHQQTIITSLEANINISGWEERQLFHMKPKEI